jgi:hypothetical protein
MTAYSGATTSTMFPSELLEWARDRELTIRECRNKFAMLNYDIGIEETYKRHFW